jgi:hypothetical protein
MRKNRDYGSEAGGMSGGRITWADLEAYCCMLTARLCQGHHFHR